MHRLNWPREAARRADSEDANWAHAGSNICLDFHGDPLRAQLVVFSDGNHHMALEACLQEFLVRVPEVNDIFYATTPPGVLLKLLEAGGLYLGNLRVSVMPHVFLSPPNILDRIVAEGRMRGHEPFMRSCGNVLLVRKGNPKQIRGIADLARLDVRLFLSNPVTEAASYKVYVETIRGMAHRQGIDTRFLDAEPGSEERIVYGERIHHREAPQALADGKADVALIYYHLALRYTRIFPEVFELVPLGGVPNDPQPHPENIVSHFSIGLIGDGGKWGAELRNFLMSEDAARVYSYHGLLRSGMRTIA